MRLQAAKAKFSSAKMTSRKLGYLKLGTRYMLADKHRQGYKIDFPVKLRPVLTFYPQKSANGVCMPQEKVWLDFVV